MNAHVRPGEHPGPTILAESSVWGTFPSAKQAEAALARLYSLGVSPDQVKVTDGDDRDPARSESGVVGGSAAAGATLGALLGATLGWMVNIGAIAIPGFGQVAGGGVLASAVGGALIGAALGGVTGALLALGVRGGASVGAAPADDDRARVLVTIHTPEIDSARLQSVLETYGAYGVRTYATQNRVPAGRPASGALGATRSSREESTEMDDDQMGRDPNSVTGTQGSFDPDTGTYGTAGTPVTTGYGVSGSTAGAGSTRGREAYESEDFTGSTPDTAPYEGGGRSSTDSAHPRLRKPSEPSVVDKYDEAHPDEAPVQIDRETRDVYERGAAYHDEPDESAPRRRRVDPDRTQASAGTNIAGTSDPRGLGDNTDDPDEPES